MELRGVELKGFWCRIERCVELRDFGAERSGSFVWN